MKFLSVLLLGSIFIGCENNPYTGENKPYPEGNTRVTPRAPQKDPADALSMVVQGKYDFKEGVRRDFRIKAAVPTPWGVDMKVDNLPAGATFDPKTLTVSWKPGYFDGNKPGDPSIKTRVYPITIWLRSTDPESEVRTKEVNLIVYDVPQVMNINGRDTDYVSEGDQLVYEFSIDNADYPNGPFAITTEGMPANSTVTPVKDTTNRFVLKFKPDHHHVKINENDECTRWNENCVRYPGKLVVYNPANHISKKNVTLQVRDRRLKPKLVSPESMEQGLDITFQVSAYDLNGEVAPDISLEGDDPDYGEFKTTIVKDEETNSSVLNVTWKDIPPSHNGETFRFKFEACSLNVNKKYNNCVSDATRVKIVVKDRKAPEFDRRDWAAGVIKYFNYKKSQTFDIDIIDGDHAWTNIRNVQIMPVQMQKYVRWNKGKLKVSFDKPGIHQFTLVAKSEYNMTTAESFVAEAFEQNRSKTLYFTDSTRDEEVKFYRDTMGDVQLMNPVLQTLNERNLSGRDTLILGTGILKDENLKNDIQRAMDKIENVVIASPLIENMPKKFIDELQQDFHISILGRYTELPNVPKLSETHFIARDDFEMTRDKIRLKEKSTDESYNPLIFSVGVDRIRCEDVLDLTDKNEEARLKIGIICDRKGGGRYAILGTEFSDFKVVNGDRKIPAKWLRRMLSTDLTNNKEVK